MRAVISFRLAFSLDKCFAAAMSKAPAAISSKGQNIRIKDKKK
jgi:hypothetical protein